MKVYEKINAMTLPDEDKDELILHIKNLELLRKSEYNTYTYCFLYILTDKDYLLRDYKEMPFWMKCFFKRHKENDTSFPAEEYATLKRVCKEKAFKFRERMYQAVKGEVSFGYLTRFLSESANDENSFLNVFLSSYEIISFAVDFDIDEINEKVNSIQDLKEKYKYITQTLREGNARQCDGRYYEMFRYNCEDIIQRIKDEMILFPASGTAEGKAPKAAQTHLPECFNNDTAKGLFQILIDLGVCVEDGELYKWKASAALFGVFVFWTSGRGCLNLLSENERIQWEPFKTAFKCDDSTLKTAQTFSSGYKRNIEFIPNGGTELKKKLVEYFHCKLK